MRTRQSILVRWLVMLFLFSIVFAGFQMVFEPWFSQVFGTPVDRIARTSLAVLLITAISIQPGVQLLALVRAQRIQARRGKCSHCGYDLRAHRPGDKCPECGTLIPAENVTIPDERSRP